MMFPLGYFRNPWMWQEEHYEISGLDLDSTIHQFYELSKSSKFSESPFLHL